MSKRGTAHPGRGIVRPDLDPDPDLDLDLDPEPEPEPDPEPGPEPDPEPCDPASPDDRFPSRRSPLSSPQTG